MYIIIYDHFLALTMKIRLILFLKLSNISGTTVYVCMYLKIILQFLMP